MVVDGGFKFRHIIQQLFADDSRRVESTCGFLNGKQNIDIGSGRAGRIADSPHGLQSCNSSRFPQRRGLVPSGPIAFHRRMLSSCHLRLDADDENVFGSDVHNIADSLEEILPVAGDEVVGSDVADRQDDSVL